MKNSFNFTSDRLSKTARLPNLAFLLIGGVAVDRFPRFKLLFICDPLRGLVINVAAILALIGSLTVWYVYAFSFFFGVVDAFFQQALRAIIPDAIPPNDLPSANSLSNLSQRLSGIIGLAVGAAVVTLGGTSLAFVLDGISFLSRQPASFPCSVG
ncbi:MAG: MFS transporter [Anaerolineaceae bacterium]|nr:MFS transporter [Anaerolineaceae bacterium]